MLRGGVDLHFVTHGDRQRHDVVVRWSDAADLVDCKSSSNIKCIGSHPRMLAHLSRIRRRFEAAKLLLELDETVNTAVEILESLLEENDSVPDVYQLLAMCLFGGGEHQEVRCRLAKPQRGSLLHSIPSATS